MTYGNGNMTVSFYCHVKYFPMKIICLQLVLLIVFTRISKCNRLNYSSL